MTTIAELFVNLGIKGSEKTVGALGSVQKGLKETASEGWAAKAALVGAFYALERLMQASAHTGAELTNFSALTGVTSKTLQQYQYAARQVGVSNQEVEGSFKSLQSVMTKTLLNGDAPKGLARVAQLTGDFGQFDIKKMAEQPELLLKRLQEYAKRENNAGLRREVLSSFGLGDAMQSALTRQAFRPEVLNRAPLLGDKEIENLDKMNASWANIEAKLKLATDHFNAKFGPQLTKDIDLMIDKVTKLVAAFMGFDKVVPLFKALDAIIEGWTFIFDGLAEAAKKAKELAEGTKKEDKNDLTVAEGAAYIGKEALSQAALGGEVDLKKLDPATSAITKFFGDLMPKLAVFFQGQMYGAAQEAKPAPGLRLVPNPTPENIAPKVQPQQSVAPSTVQNNNVTQNLNFSHDGKDASKTATSVKEAVNQAVRQSSAQSQRK